MKNLILFIAVAVGFSYAAQARSLTDNVDALGGNKDLIRKARALDPNNKVRVVQKRTVDRNWRLEMGVNYGMVAGGDPYLTSNTFGGNLDLHINPMWSVGARYYQHYNELTSEGRRIFDQAKAAGSNVPDIVDYPLTTTLGVMSFYPVYGKLNFFDMGIAQFDLYLLGGGGQMKLQNGTTSTWTAGGGVGLWLSQHFSSRLEVRYQAYTDQVEQRSRDMNLVVSTFSIGFIL